MQEICTVIFMDIIFSGQKELLYFPFRFSFTKQFKQFLFYHQILDIAFMKQAICQEKHHN